RHRTDAGVHPERARAGRRGGAGRAGRPPGAAGGRGARPGGGGGGAVPEPGGNRAGRPGTVTAGAGDGRAGVTPGAAVSPDASLTPSPPPVRRSAHRNRRERAIGPARRRKTDAGGGARAANGLLRRPIRARGPPVLTFRTVPVQVRGGHSPIRTGTSGQERSHNKPGQNRGPAVQHPARPEPGPNGQRDQEAGGRSMGQWTAEERQREIVRLARATGSVDVTALAADLGVAKETVRRDLRALEDHGLVRRTHGGAYPVESAGFETTLAFRATSHVPEKRRVAAAAAELLGDAETVFIDEGFTPQLIAEA